MKIKVKSIIDDLDTLLVSEIIGQFSLVVATTP